MFSAYSKMVGSLIVLVLDNDEGRQIPLNLIFSPPIVLSPSVRRPPVQHRKTFKARCGHSGDAQLVGLCTADGKPRQSGLFEGNCFAMTDTERDAFPNVTLQLANSTSMVLLPASYLRQGTMFCQVRRHGQMIYRFTMMRVVYCSVELAVVECRM